MFTWLHFFAAGPVPLFPAPQLMTGAPTPSPPSTQARYNMHIAPPAVFQYHGGMVVAPGFKLMPHVANHAFGHPPQLWLDLAAVQYPNTVTMSSEARELRKASTLVEAAMAQTADGPHQSARSGSSAEGEAKETQPLPSPGSSGVRPPYK